MKFNPLPTSQIRNLLASSVIAAAAALGALAIMPAPSVAQDVPKPSIYPISWELKFDHGRPKRIVVDNQAYWYITFSVTNNTNKEVLFLPIFEMLDRAGNVTRSDNAIPDQVFATVKKREHNQFLVPFVHAGGELRVGEDQSRDSVAIWKEPLPRMGTFHLFVGGLSGESIMLKDDAGQPMKDKDDQPVILRKTLQLTYRVRGDEVFAGDDTIEDRGSQWVMR